MRYSAGLTLLTMIGLLCFGGSFQQETCTVSIRLIDVQTGRQLPGLLRVSDSDGKPVAVDGLLSRGLGLDADLPINRWWVLPEMKTVQLPKQKLRIEAVSGLETELTATTVDLSGKTRAEVSIPLTRFYDASSKGFRSANTHLHLQKITRKQCDRYLAEIPRADGLDVLFLSYLERAVADKQYTSNRYTDGDLRSLTKKSGVEFGNGEEHRHNFTKSGQGYGHVMLLNIKKLILPVSIGPGIMKLGTDGIPLQRGIDTARKDGATIVWCHNEWGMESTPNFITGRIDAQNIFDGGIRSSYKDSFYRHLNAGLRVPFSTGTDWFMYDFSRVYVDMQGDVTPESWLKGLADGRSYITNGPFLEFRVAGKEIGETVRLKKPGRVTLEGRALGRSDFGRIEAIRDGRVIGKAASRRVGKHFEAELSIEVDLDSPAWLALRTPPQPIKDDPELNEPVGTNLLGRELFAHTSPVYVEVAGRKHFNRAVADELLAEMQADSKTIAERGLFADAQERERVLDVYRDAIKEFRERIKQQ